MSSLVPVFKNVRSTAYLSTVASVRNDETFNSSRATPVAGLDMCKAFERV